MANFGSRRGFADKLSLPLMILAFVVVIGFLFWLNVTAKPTQVDIVEEEVRASSGASAILSEADFLSGPGQYEGQIVEVTDARVASGLGSQAFWIGPDGTPFLVKMGPELVEAGTQVLNLQRLHLTGTVWVMSDSTHAAWDALGAFPNEGDRIVAEFAIGSPFLEVTAIEVQSGTGGDAGAGGTD
jgi:hypothetical protein